MASAIVQELQRLGQGWAKPAGGHAKARASLLFQPQQAADVDAQTIYAIGLAGRPLPPPPSVLLLRDARATDCWVDKTGQKALERGGTSA